MDKMKELKEELKKTSAGRVFLEEAEPENHTNKLIEFTKDHDKMIEFAIEHCDIFPEDSYMGKYLRETLKMLQAEPSEDCVSRKSLIHKLQERYDFFVDAYGGFINLPQKDKARVDAISNCIAMVVNEPPVTITHKRLIEQKPCGDAISREDVIKAVDRHTFDTDDGLCLDEDISIILEELPPVTPTQNWIPVSERLPKKRGVYIVTEKVFSVTDKEHTGGFNLMTEQVEFDNGKWRRASFYEVVAWMPLPKPYKTETESEV